MYQGGISSLLFVVSIPGIRQWWSYGFFLLDFFLSFYFTENNAFCVIYSVALCAAHNCGGTRDAGGYTGTDTHTRDRKHMRRASRGPDGRPAGATPRELRRRQPPTACASAISSSTTAAATAAARSVVVRRARLVFN